MTPSQFKDGVDLKVERHLLRVYRKRLDILLPDTFWQSLRDKKSKATTNCDQKTAKLVWCLETIGRIQDHFLSAFLSIHKGEFMAAWYELERCEAELSFLNKHFSEQDNEFGIEHIRIHSNGGAPASGVVPIHCRFQPSLCHRKDELFDLRCEDHAP